MMNSIVEAVFAYAQRTPEKLCLADDAEHVSYAEYTARITAAAAALEGLGITGGDRVVIEAAQTVRFLSLELALHLLGAVFVPVERNCAPEKIAAFAAQTEAKLILTAKELAAETPVTHMTLDELFARVTPSEKVYPFPAREDVSELLFTTGTTGKEKGIILTHGNDIALAENVIDGVEMAKDNVELIPSPMNHSHGLRRYYANLWNGCSVVLLSSIMNMFVFFTDMDTYGVNSIDLVPSALSVLLRLSKGKLAEYADRLRYVQFGSAPLAAADKDAVRALLPRTRLYNFYGSTESGCIIIEDFAARDKENCIGHPVVNAEILIVDDDRKPIASDSEHTGLLASRGPMNMVGYYKDPEETARALNDGIVYSNDIAYIDEAGDVILLGRKGDVMNIGGRKVTPGEIEDAAAACLPMVKDCACVPMPDPIKGNVPKLFVVMKRGKTFDPAEIRSLLAARLELYKVPEVITTIDEIPRSFNGKILRRELLEK